MGFGRSSLVAAIAALGLASLLGTDALLVPSRAEEKKAPRDVEIDLDKAVAIAMPDFKDEAPASWKTPDGREGWVVRIPGNRPIATPAYADGLIFVGGGYGSHEFYAFNAQTGELAWKVTTQDDGPSAAVVEDGLVAFNTESCTVIVVEAKTGKLVWQEWLGDPLMSQPAIDKGKLFIAFPAGQRAQAAPVGSVTDVKGGHHLLCADLKTGKHIWEQAISGDVVSAPVVDGDKVYFTCFDGTSFCLDERSGNIDWKKQSGATSAPVVAKGQMVLSQKKGAEGKSEEGLARFDALRGESRDRELLVREKARYLDAGEGGGVALVSTQTAQLDASVGFGSAPAAASLAKANDHFGVSTVVGAWAYQGSRAACKGDQILNAQGRFVNCLGSKDGAVAWRGQAKLSGLAEGAQLFSPPSLGKKNLYLSSALGHLLAVSYDGKVEFAYATGQPIAFQPTLACGNVYVGTTNGLVICLKTGILSDGTKNGSSALATNASWDADGWHSWGGDAQHKSVR